MKDLNWFKRISSKINLNKAFTLSPWFYGVFYFLLIPIFSILYFITPGFTASKLPLSIVDSFYFSVVTITTLGYGDILPTTDIAKFIVSSESILGILTIGLFLNALANRQSEASTKRQEQKEETRRITETISNLNNHHSLISMQIRIFERRCIPITNKVIVKKENDYAPFPTKINPNFKFNDMCDLYMNSTSVSDDMFKSFISYYFEAEEAFVNEVRELVRNVNLHIWPDFNKACQVFLDRNKKYNFNAFILSQEKISSGGQPSIIQIKKMIAEFDEPIEFKNGPNAINPYISLYYSIKNNLEFIKVYNNAVERIQSKS